MQEAAETYRPAHQLLENQAIQFDIAILCDARPCALSGNASKHSGKTQKGLNTVQRSFDVRQEIVINLSLHFGGYIREPNEHTGLL